MKKVTLTDKQKRILKTTVVFAGGAVCVVIGAKVISRTELGALIKDKMIDRLIRSKCRVNGYTLQMDTFVSNKVCSDAAVVERAHKEAYALWRSIIMEAKDAG